MQTYVKGGREGEETCDDRVPANDMQRMPHADAQRAKASMHGAEKASALVSVQV